jgi:RNA polymerase sigma factor (sigma-70 family)
VASQRVGPGIARLLRAVRTRDAEGHSDGQLLRWFLAGRDEATFAALLQRHGPMVLGVCRRVLRNEADAEDAFQATFLVLVRKAASLSSRAVLGDWLHGVARRTALNARRLAARRREKESAMARPEAQGPAAEGDWLPLLDEELRRLPDKYRLPLVLCDLEGRTRREAAGRLGWPEGTVAGRLARGRALLAGRLKRRGLAPSDGALAAALAHGAGVPPPLLTSTTKAASLFAAGQAAAAVASARVAALAEGALKTMLLTKLSVAFLAAVAVVTAGAVVYACRAAADLPATPPAASAAPAGRAADPGKGEAPADKPRGLTAHIVAPKEVAADDPELKGELVLTNDGDDPVRVCTLTPGNDGLGGAFGQHFRPDWWKSDSPPLEMSAKKVMTLAPGKSVSFPFTIRRVHYKDRDSFTITGFYAVEDKEFADKLGLWLGKAEAEPVKVTVGKEPAWGEADGGVQARIRTPKVAWDLGEAPTFILDLRNQGKQTPRAFQRPFDCAIEVDGTWYAYGKPVSWVGPTEPTPLEPGKQFNDWLTVSVDDSWVDKSPSLAPGAKGRLSLPPGKHTIRIAFPLDGAKPLRPISGPVEIEVREGDGK